MRDRTEALKALLSLDRPIDEIIASLSKIEWDSEELIVIKPDHIKRSLERYLSGELIPRFLCQLQSCRQSIYY